jgi:hypothetical protein
MSFFVHDFPLLRSPRTRRTPCDAVGPHSYHFVAGVRAIDEDALVLESRTSRRSVAVSMARTPVRACPTRPPRGVTECFDQPCGREQIDGIFPHQV